MTKNVYIIDSVSKITLLLFVFISVVFLVFSIIKFNDNYEELDVNTMERVISKTVMQCYASEGSFPPNLDYLVDNYGLQIDSKKYYYSYRVFSSNVLPEIRVIKK